ncbi:hypothetical protein BDFB_000185 [Asbolus verrucosus]|uniref:Uncharacterized protein n=1 Tax=Asbolus verrucosus TaxID=1661398 RepID=A0A482W292_ASBVE|nr:hypothetical protein BDFB_000185 [Asbolus verrucosus]
MLGTANTAILPLPRYSANRHHSLRGCLRLLPLSMLITSQMS